MEYLEVLFPTGIPSWIKTYKAPGENHPFQVSPLCNTGRWSDLTYSAPTRDVMVKWLTAQMKAL